VCGEEWWGLSREKELDGPVVSAHRRAIAEVKQRWSVIGPKIYYLELLRCFGRHIRSLIPAAFAVVSNH
jgi:hypothetical protein